MAVIHQKAGQFGKTEAQKRALWEMMALFLITILFTSVLTFIFGYFQGSRFRIFAPIAVLLPIVAGAFAWKRIEPVFESRAKQRVRYMRGAQAEALVAYILKEESDDCWHLFNGVKVEKQSDIDHVLIGPGGVFCIYARQVERVVKVMEMIQQSAADVHERPPRV